MKRVDHKKVYARGYFDGLKAAGVDEVSTLQPKDEQMNKAKLDSIMANVSAVSKKVYEAVPINEAWSIVQIHNEIIRHGPGQQDKRMTEGCLNSLKEQGLIREMKTGHFIRKNIHAKPSPDKPKAEPPMKLVAEPEQTIKGESPLVMLSNISDRMREISEELDQLVGTVELTAIAIDDLMSSKEKEYEKLGQLKA